MVTFATKPLAPIGMHVGILYQFIDLGTQEVKFEGKPIQHTPKVRFNFELPEELMPDGRPFSVGTDYTASLSDKANLVIDIKSWTGEKITRDYDFKKLLGKPVNLNVTHNDKGTYEKIAALSPLMKGQTAPKPVNELVYFDLAKFDMETFVKLSSYHQDLIKKSPEYKTLMDMDSKADLNHPAFQ